MSNKGYVATAGGFCVAISRKTATKKTNTQQNAVTSTNIATESTTPSIKTTATKKSA